MVSAPAVVEVRAVVGTVPDPELPVITIEDLGVLRDVRIGPDGRVVVEITPTYSGCPAMDVIRADVLARLTECGYEDAEVRLVLAPAWTTDWISDAGRAALRGARNRTAAPSRTGVAQAVGALSALRFTGHP